MATHSAQAVAAEIRRRLPGVPVKKLHKLLYYAQAHHVSVFGDPLFSETVSTWDMGPVVGQLWWSEKQHGPATRGGGERDEAALNTIAFVISTYGALSGLELERLTHSETPWQAADTLRRDLGEPSHTITLESLQHYFSQQEADAETTDPPLGRSQINAWLDAIENRARVAPSPDNFESLAARRR